MNVYRSIAEWRERRNQITASIGFVPTMGALHRGHSSLVDLSCRENQFSVVSIFVNPTQFNNEQDLARYPRTLDRDLDRLRSLGTQCVLVPEASELYRDGFQYHVDYEDPDKFMELKHRPGHFRGVLTVVIKLLNIVQPARVYFGEKDFEQLRLVRGMAASLFLPVEVVACPTVRDEFGLAESSRNALLSPTGRGRAAGLFRALNASCSCEEARAALIAGGFTVDYVEEHWGRRFGAVSIEGVRLIDNVPFDRTSKEEF